MVLRSPVRKISSILKWVRTGQKSKNGYVIFRSDIMILTNSTNFIVTEKKTGKRYFPKGVYWTGKGRKDLVIIGDNTDHVQNHSTRLKLPSEEYTVEVMETP